VAIHSDRSQPERTRALEGFKSGEIRVLVATDVAARGLDIEDLPVVVNFELPWNPQDYIHRIGRTGRAGASGEAISLVCIDEVDLLRGVQRMLKRAIPWTVEDGFIPDRNAEPRPLGMRTGHARVTAASHHAHRKPVRRSGRGHALGGHRSAAGERRWRVRCLLEADRGRPREEEAEHDVGQHRSRAVAVDERVGDGDPLLRVGRRRGEMHVAQEDELAARPGQCATRVVAGQGRQLAVDDVGAELEPDPVPRGVDRGRGLLVGQRRSGRRRPGS
jgi:superfamily II DNA/RNA helicase